MKESLSRFFIWLFLPLLSIPVALEPAPAEAGTFKVMTYNIHHGWNEAGRKKIDEVVAVIESEKPDILAIQEVRLADLDRIRERSGLEHMVKLPTYNSRNSGLALFSRWPIVYKTHTLVCSKGKRAFIQAAIDLEGLPLAFFNVHLTRDGISKDTPLKDFSLEMSSDSPRVKQVVQIMKILERDKHRYKIVAGDFNTFTNSRPYSELKMILNEVTEGFPSIPGTYRSLWFFKPKIDHIFHSPNIRVHQAGVIESGPSDHFPVTAVLEIDPDCPQSLIDSREVEKAQEILARLGFYKGAVDAVPGPQTKRAVSVFQEKNGHTIDGCLNKTLLDYLFTRK